jgi:hypothetical protein
VGGPAGGGRPAAPRLCVWPRPASQAAPIQPSLLPSLRPTPASPPRSDTRATRPPSRNSRRPHTPPLPHPHQPPAPPQAIETGWLHPTLNQHNLVDEVAGIDTVPNEKKALEVTAACSNSFGFGGHNSAVIFAPYKA